MNDPAPAEDSSADPLSSSEPAVVRVLEIVNSKGLHARASAKFVQTVEKFAPTAVTVIKGRERVGGTSILGLMMLAAGIGATIEIAAEGPEAQPALDALVELVQSRFDEDQ